MRACEERHIHREVIPSMKANFHSALVVAWHKGFDDPHGAYITPGDPGGETNGAVILTTWNDAVARGIVSGDLRNATNQQLEDVLHGLFWGDFCDALPGGLDVAYFLALMASGETPRLFQQAVGAVVDGRAGQMTIKAAWACDHARACYVMFALHHAYLSTLPNWPVDKNGWTTRLIATLQAALALCNPAPAGAAGS